VQQQPQQQPLLQPLQEAQPPAHTTTGWKSSFTALDQLSLPDQPQNLSITHPLTIMQLFLPSLFLSRLFLWLPLLKRLLHKRLFSIRLILL
jgi:hypothetical protein